MGKNEIFEKAISAAKEASKLIMEVYNSSDFDVEIKGDLSPLTRADKLSHKAIDSILSGTGFPVLSEEGKNIPYEIRKNWEYFWMVDPLDGTKEFLKRNGEFTVNIALIHFNKPVWGVVYVPAQNKFYSGGFGEAFVEEEEKRILLSKRTKELDFNLSGLRVVASRSHLDEKTKAFLSGLKKPVLVSMGSSLKFMLIAEGKADIYPRFAPTMEWDTAASQAILDELGYHVKQEDSDSSLQYNKANLLNPGFIVI